MDWVRYLGMGDNVNNEDWKDEIEVEKSDADQMLFDNHPHEIFCVINPKTGRFVKRFRCCARDWLKIFKKQSNFRDHIRSHNGIKPYKCNQCDKDFTQKGNLDKHLRKHNLSGTLQSRKIHECPICKRKFTEKYNMKAHMATQHPKKV